MSGTLLSLDAVTGRNDIKTNCVEIDPLIACGNCDRTGQLHDEYKRPSTCQCPCCAGTGAQEEPAREFLNRICDLAGIGVTETENLLVSLLDDLLTQVECESEQVQLDLRATIARRLLPGCTVEFDGDRPHDIEIGRNGNYHRV